MEKTFLKGRIKLELLDGSLLFGFANDEPYFYLVIGIFAFGIRTKSPKNTF